MKKFLIIASLAAPFLVSSVSFAQDDATPKPAKKGKKGKKAKAAKTEDAAAKPAEGAAAGEKPAGDAPAANP